ncbi:hypothetical protein BG004_007139, partial [Podila humilis]
NKMLEAIAETMVLPNMDDIPFSDSKDMGGIFGKEISPGGEAARPTPSIFQRITKVRSAKAATKPRTVRHYQSC